LAGLVRDFLLSSHSRILYEELPNVDRLLRMLNDILLVRSLSLLELEVELYDKLVYIFRDTALLIRLTSEWSRSQQQKKLQ
jgi:hypothetical protein